MCIINIRKLRINKWIIEEEISDHDHKEIISDEEPRL